MIEFYGEISNKNKQLWQKKANKVNFIAALLEIIVCSIPVILAGMFLNSWIYLFLIVPILMGVLLVIPKINPQKQLLPIKVIIEDQMVEGEAETAISIEVKDKTISQSRFITDIKEVIDEGDWYHVIFYFPRKSLYFVCQKDLITKGTIEDFEKLFEGKIKCSPKAKNN